MRREAASVALTRPPLPNQMSSGPSYRPSRQLQPRANYRPPKPFKISTWKKRMMISTRKAISTSWAAVSNRDGEGGSNGKWIESPD